MFTEKLGKAKNTLFYPLTATYEFFFKKKTASHQVNVNNPKDSLQKEAPATTTLQKIKNAFPVRNPFATFSFKAISEGFKKISNSLFSIWPSNKKEELAEAEEQDNKVAAEIIQRATRVMQAKYKVAVKKEKVSKAIEQREVSEKLDDCIQTTYSNLQLNDQNGSPEDTSAAQIQALSQSVKHELMLYKLHQLEHRLKLIKKTSKPVTTTGSEPPTIRL